MCDVDQTRAILRFDRWQRRIFRFARKHADLVRLSQLDYSTPGKGDLRFPIYLLEIGKPSAFKRASASIVSGVHGLETIGVRIHLDTIAAMLNAKSRFYSKDIVKGRLGIYSIPILNPAGVALQTRANAKGVDLNRNSGVAAEHAIPFFGGHTLSPSLPYYSGKTRQRETRALLDFYKERVWPKLTSVHRSLDIHSGYGSENYLWWPYSFSDRKVFDEREFLKLAEALHAMHPAYRIEPMSQSYQTNGDLWDAALIEFAAHEQRKRKRDRSHFLPFTLEIGTWHELKKSPRRLFSREKIFNPPKADRKTYLKAHRALICDFLHVPI